MIDNLVIGTWNLASDTPFTLETASFSVATGGSHVLAFKGTTPGDHTAFLSGVTIETTSSVTVSPATGFPGVPIVVSAAGFVPSETLYLIGYGSTPAVIGAGIANSSGSVTIAARIPQTPYGTYGLQAVGETSKTVASGTVSIAPQLQVTPNNGTAQTAFSAEGFGFAAGEAVYLTWLSPSALLGIVATNASGTSAALTFTPPSSAAVGVNTLIAIGQRSGAIASAQITIE